MNSGTSKAFDGRVLSIAKLRVGQEAYQLSGVAQSLDDYYTGAGEASGQWAGIGAERLGLSGEVAADDLRAVLAGMAPGTGGLTPNGETIRPHPRRVPGFDLTFKAPKSVSVLYAVTDDPRVQGAIIDAGEVAVRAALGWLGREAAHVRRGNGDAAYINDLAARDPEAAEAARIRTLPATGLVAAMFRHRTSRAGDPLLHWHTLVANLAEGPDGRWTAIVHPDIYHAVRAAGEVFQTVLRDELSTSLDLTWRPGRHVPEVAGVPQGLLDVFSKRSKEIEDWLEATGTPGDRAGRQAAVLATRRAKPEVESERFDTAWKAEATAYGWGPEHAETLMGSLGHPTAAPLVVDDAWVGRIARDLTEHDATFDRNDLVQAVAARLETGASMRTIERTVAAVLASPLVVPVGDKHDRGTSSELLGVERRLLSTAASSVGSRNRVDGAIVASALGGFPTIGIDQHAAVMALAGSTDAVSVLVGPAGTGKTFTLDAIRVAYEHFGCQVIGAAPSARAAHELEQGAHIPSVTMHRLLGSWERGFDLPNPSTVLVVDESAMAGTRELEAVVARAVGAGGRVLLVGDHHQLPEVTAGGGFAALATGHTVTVAELTVNRRQTHEWERIALGELRDGHVAAAVDAYRSHGRVHVAPDHATMLTAAVGHWSGAISDGHRPVLIAGTNATVNALNGAARAHRLATGQIGAHVGAWAGLDLAVGEHVVLRANNYRTVDVDGRPTPLLNGHTATILGATAGGLLARLDHTDTTVELDHAYLTSRGVDYGYALTSHRAQGGTWDLAICVGADGLYREAGYLALSRGRIENLLILTQTELDGFDAELARHDSPLALPGETPEDIDTELTRRLNQSRAKTLAITDDPYADLITRLAERTSLATLEALAHNAVSAEARALAIIGVRPISLQDRIDRATQTASHVAIGQAVKPTDRNNIGIVTALDDTAGRVNVEFISAEGRTAERSFRWDDLTIIKPRHPAARVRAAAATNALATIVGEHRDGIDRWARLLASDNVAVDDAHIYGRAGRLHVDRATARIVAAQPDWLTRILGERPTAPAAAQVWDDSVRDIASYRTRHQISDRTTPLGAPEVADQLIAWEGASTNVAEARIWLDTYSPEPTRPLRARSAAELAERRTELDVILATAPADQRHVITALTSGQLTLDDTAEVLRDALAQQGDRRRWILEHWPHIVESFELDGARSDDPSATPELTPDIHETVRDDLSAQPMLLDLDLI